ncbi:MAG: FkbM family methyltransferase [Patescibacteria group bacterium]
MLNIYAWRAHSHLWRLINKILLTLITVRNFVSAGLDYLQLSSGPYLILKLYSGLKIKVRSNTVDAHEVVTILSGQEYPFKIIAPALNPQAVIIDIGAHIGSFTLYLKNKLPSSRVYCFEPAQSNYNILVDNINLNGLQNVKAIKMALAGKSGSAYLKTAGLNSNAYNLGNAGEAVASIDLDTFLRGENLENIDLLKMDCEGTEYEILSNFKQLNKIKSIILEYHRLDDQFNGQYIINLLTAQGFVLNFRQDLFDYERGILYFIRDSIE